MIPVGLGITVLGYSIFYYGVTQIKGGNWGYLDLTLPTRWTVQVAATARDGNTGTVATDGAGSSGSPSILGEANKIGTKLTKFLLGPIF